MLGKESAKTALERTAAFHGRLTGSKEDNVVGHETEDGVDVTCSGCAVPTRNKIANGLFFSVHGNSLCDAQRINLAGGYADARRVEAVYRPVRLSAG